MICFYALQMLVYEFMQNGTLRDHLSGKYCYNFFWPYYLHYHHCTFTCAVPCCDYDDNSSSLILYFGHAI